MVDLDGVGLAFALKCAKAEHDVRLWIDKKKNNPLTGKGFDSIKLVDNWLASAQWADLIVPTDNKMFVEKFDYLRKQGIKVFGPSKKSADLEIKRSQGMKFFEEHGVEVPEWQQFKSLEEAEAHVRKTEERYVFKTLGDNEDKSLSYVSKTPADMIARLQLWQKLKMNPKGPVMLQKVIEGVEFAAMYWVGAQGFVGVPSESFEHKKLLSGNCGPNCGEAGTLCKYVDESKLSDAVLKPLEQSLVSMGHLGEIDVNCIVDGEGKAWPLEFTARPGWPQTNILLSVHSGDPCQWMLDACEGKDTLKTIGKVSCGIVLAQPDYPYSEATKAETTGIPIYGVTKANETYIYPQSVMIDSLPDMKDGKVVEREMWATTGDYIAVVTGTGRTVKQACGRAYETLKEISVPNMIYRDDIGEKLEKEIPELQKHGYASEWRYE